MSLPCTRFGVWFQAVGPLVPFNPTFTTAPVYPQHPHPTILPADFVPVCQGIPNVTEPVQQVLVYRGCTSMQSFPSMPEFLLTRSCLFICDCCFLSCISFSMPECRHTCCDCLNELCFQHAEPGYLFQQQSC